MTNLGTDSQRVGIAFVRDGDIEVVVRSCSVSIRVRADMPPSKIVGHRPVILVWREGRSIVGQRAVRLWVAGVHSNLH